MAKLPLAGTIVSINPVGATGGGLLGHLANSGGPAPNFSLSVLANALQVTGGDSAVSIQLTVTALNGFSGVVTLALSPSSTSPSIHLIEFRPSSVTLTAETTSAVSQLMVATTPGTPDGLPCMAACTIPVGVTGSSGAISHAVQTSLAIVDPFICAYLAAECGPANVGSFDLGSIAVGSTSAPISVPLSSISPTPVAILSMSLINSPGGANSADFSVNSGTCGSLSQFSSCNIAFTFTPAAKGRRGASLYIEYTRVPQDVSKRPLHEFIPVSGTGQ